jgi:hypothetical protein
MTRSFLILCAALIFMGASPALETATAPLLKRAEAATKRGDWSAAVTDLRAVRDMAVKSAGANDPGALHAGTLLVQALTQAGNYDDAIAEGVAPLHAYSAPATKNNIDGLYLRYYLAEAFQRCRSARCGDEPHRMGNVDALMEALMAGLASYPKGDQRVGELRATFTQTCLQRYEAADCAAASGQ